MNSFDSVLTGNHDKVFLRSSQRTYTQMSNFTAENSAIRRSGSVTGNADIETKLLPVSLSPSTAGEAQSRVLLTLLSVPCTSFRDKSHPSKRSRPLKRAGNATIRVATSDETTTAASHPMDMSSPDNPAIDSLDTTSGSCLPSVHFSFENTYARLPEHFYARQAPTPVAAPQLVKVNVDLARSLGLDPNALTSADGVQILAGNRVADGSEPISLAYAGHQFGYFVPQLGDGRAILLGEVIGNDGVRYDIQLKGSGTTPFSRGDGRAVLGPVLREYIVSEAMAALCVPTSRALAAVTTGERVLRDTILPGAIFTRVAASHLRVGTFQFFAARGDTEGLFTLANYAIARHYPQAAQAENPFRALLDAVITRQAHLVAQWMLIGFIHGVMNTDNTSISGETIDYGPCAFMEAYDPATVFSAIDENGRYAYANQPRIALWNLTKLAEALLPLLEQESISQRTSSLEPGSQKSDSRKEAVTSANEALAAFDPQFQAARLAGLRRKLGLHTERSEDLALAEDLLERMAANRADFTLTFRRLCDAAAGIEGDVGVRELFVVRSAYDGWAAKWRQRIAQESITPEARATVMRKANPAIIPRNHIVEEALNAAMWKDDFQPFEELLKAVSRPYDNRPDLDRFETPARPEECVRQTFCGT
jgi:serine/tyrosine/threonine adenylyltransferase